MNATSRRAEEGNRRRATCQHHKAINAFVILGSLAVLLAVYFALSDRTSYETPEESSNAPTERDGDPKGRRHYLVSPDANHTIRFPPYHRVHSKTTTSLLTTKALGTERNSSQSTTAPRTSNETSITSWNVTDSEVLNATNSGATTILTPTNNSFKTLPHTVSNSATTTSASPTNPASATTVSTHTTTSPQNSTHETDHNFTSTIPPLRKGSSTSVAVPTTEYDLTTNVSSNPTNSTVPEMSHVPTSTSTASAEGLFNLNTSTRYNTTQSETTATAGEEAVTFPSVHTPSYNVVCIFNHTSYKRKAPMAFLAAHIPAPYCSHLVYSSAMIAPDSTIKARDAKHDEHEDGFLSALMLKNTYPHLRVLIHIGSTSNDSEVLGRICSTTDGRRTFADNVRTWLVRREYDGIVLDWRHYESTTHFKARSGSVAEALRLALSTKYTFWITIPHDNELRQQYFDLSRLSDSVDGFLVIGDSKSYDAERTSSLDLVNDVLQMRHSGTAGMSNAIYKKVCFPLPIGGRSYTLANATQQGVNSEVSGPGLPGPYTETPGLLAYYEICSRNWTTEVHETFESYTAEGNQWVGFLDVANIEKILWMVIWKHRSSCISIWDVSLDDFRGVCGERYPLSKAVAGWKVRNQDNRRHQHK
ncbi:chitinase-3-like protein 1 [Ornithodoros turicata]|uniref:chitinase-3-like protein 1 n=1 Tax=Ornithodoros turicata TaxID=34597 RepID=UPI003138EB12